MMAELPIALLVVAIVVVWAVVIVRLGLLTSPEVRVWRRLAALRGLSPHRSAALRVATRITAIQRVQEELDVERLLAVGQRDETAASFVAATIFIAVAATLITTTLLVAARLDGAASPPVQLALLAPVVAVVLRGVVLRRDASRMRLRVDRTLGDMMMLVGVVTDGRGLQLDDAITLLSRCATTSELANLHSGGWRRLVEPVPSSTLDRYRAIAAAYDLPTYSSVADALQSTHVGLGERDSYTRVAEAVYARRLSAARERAARLRILVTLPVAAMLIPLLLLLGAPAFASISSGLGQ